MELGTPQDWAQGAGAFKSAMEAIRTVVDLVRSANAGGKQPTALEQAQIERAVAEADKAAKIADAQTAKALGYELCRCEFPPVAMLTVGFMLRGKDAGRPVHECMSCGRVTSGPFSFQRTVPTKDKALRT